MEPKEELKTLYGYLNELEELEKRIESLKAEVRMLKTDKKEIKQKISDLKEGKNESEGSSDGMGSRQ